MQLNHDDLFPISVVLKHRPVISLNDASTHFKSELTYFGLRKNTSADLFCAAKVGQRLAINNLVMA